MSIYSQGINFNSESMLTVNSEKSFIDHSQIDFNTFIFAEIQAGAVKNTKVFYPLRDTHYLEENKKLDTLIAGEKSQIEKADQRINENTALQNFVKVQSFAEIKRQKEANLRSLEGQKKLNTQYHADYLTATAEHRKQEISYLKSIIAELEIDIKAAEKK